MTDPMLQIQSLTSNGRAWLLDLNCKHALSESYALSCRVLTDARMDFEKVLGQPQSISCNIGKSQRYFHGRTSSIEQQDSPYCPLFCYNLMIHPDLYFLQYHTDCRIFQHKTVLDITRFWFNLFGITNVDYSGLSASYNKLNYCVQFNETVYDFLLRLWAQAGIFFWFDFEEGKHILMLADGVHAYSQTKQSFPFGPRQGYHFSDWEHTLNPKPRNLTLIDYDYQQPEVRLEHNIHSNGLHSSHAQPYALYPGGFRSFAQAESIAAVENQRLLVDQDVVTARSNIPNILLGDVVALTNDSDNTFVVTSIEHRISDDSHLPIKLNAHTSTYCNILQAIPSGKVFRSAAVPKPTFSGVHTAVVSGPSGNDVYTDDLCRIKVKFHWDRHGEANENSSCWMRVAQGWAGKNYGMQFVPRVGQEVLVRYMQGDLDYPVVIGAVYNAINKPPYDLPQQAAISCIKTASATSVHANELLFDDTPGKQQLLLHAAHDFQQTVLTNHDMTVKQDSMVNVGNNMQVDVKQGEYSIDANDIELIAGNSSITLSSQGIQIQADMVTFNS